MLNDLNRPESVTMNDSKKNLTEEIARNDSYTKYILNIEPISQVIQLNLLV